MILTHLSLKEHKNEIRRLDTCSGKANQKPVYVCTVYVYVTESNKKH